MRLHSETTKTSQRGLLKYLKEKMFCTKHTSRRHEEYFEVSTKLKPHLIRISSFCSETDRNISDGVSLKPSQNRNHYRAEKSSIEQKPYPFRCPFPKPSRSKLRDEAGKTTSSRWLLLAFDSLCAIPTSYYERQDLEGVYFATF